MKKVKMIVALLLVVLMSMSAVVMLAACDNGKNGKEDDGKIELVLWAPSAAQTFYKEWTKKWAEGYTDANGVVHEGFKDLDGKEYKVTLGIESEGSVADPLMTSPTDGADLFLMADDQVAKLAKAGILSAIGEGAIKEDVVARNSASSVTSASYDLGDGDGLQLFAYPMQADNTYFLYYNSKFFEEKDLVSWTTIFDRLDEINNGKTGGERKKVQFDYGTAWYQASWFFSFGGQVTETTETFSNPEIGKKAMQAAYEFTKRGGEDIEYTDPDSAKAGLIDTSIVAGVGGGWIYSGDDGLEQNPDIKTAILPKIILSTGEEAQMKAFIGCKLIGVNAFSAYPYAANMLANFLTSEEVQRDKALQLYAGPSNINAAADPEIAALPTVKAAADQAAFAVPQINLPVGFWDALPVAIDPVKSSNNPAKYFNADGTVNQEGAALLETLHNTMMGLLVS